MVTFFIALILLIGGYLVYSRVSEKVFALDDRKTPAIANPDGVDTFGLPVFKTGAFTNSAILPKWGSTDRL